MKPIAVFITVRNRLAITKKCIESLYLNTNRPIHLFVFDNCMSTRLDEHFIYFCNLYKVGRLQKYVVNTVTSTYNAFSKAMSFNEFGLFIESHPNKNEYEWLLCLDNDMIIIQKGWDDYIASMFNEVDKHEGNTIQIVTQYPGGVSGSDHMFGNIKVRVGVNGGSGFWNIRPDFFSKVGLLEPEPLLGISKRHDIHYWEKLNKFSRGQPYTVAIDLPLALHVAYCNGMDLSVCKAIRNDHASNVDFESFDALVEGLQYDDFLEWIKRDEDVFRRW